jgi:hypothetical protein
VVTNGYAPVAGNTYTILTAAAVSGAFFATNLPDVYGIGWTVTNTGSALVLQAYSTILSPYEQWAAPFGLAAGSETNDSDGDGFINLLEYSQNSDPTNSASLALMQSGRSNSVLQLKFLRYTNAADITYIVEGAYGVTNGAEWIGLNTNEHSGAWTDPAYVAEAGAGPTLSVTVSDPVAGATNRYMRLRVTKP